MCKVCAQVLASEDFQPQTRKTCRRCAAAQRKQRRSLNLSQEKEAAKKYRERNREKVAEHKRQYQAGPGKAKMLAASRRYSHTQRGEERNRRSQKKYQQTQKGRLSGRLRTARRRVLLMQVGGTFTPQQWERVLTQQANRCFYCRLIFKRTRLPTIDHVVPLTAGGRHEQSNIVAARRPCNSKKRDRRILLV